MGRNKDISQRRVRLAEARQETANALIYLRQLTAEAVVAYRHLNDRDGEQRSRSLSANGEKCLRELSKWLETQDEILDDTDGRGFNRLVRQKLIEKMIQIAGYLGDQELAELIRDRVRD